MVQQYSHGSNLGKYLIFVSTAHAQADTKTEKKFVDLLICNRQSISDLLCRGESVRLIPTNHL